MTLSAAELALNWVEYHCDRHGFLVAMGPRAEVICACGKSARRFRHGRTVDPKTLRPTAARAKRLNRAEQPFIYGCDDCGEDFGGRDLQRRHVTGRAPSKRCLAPDEMQGKGWHRDKKGRWRRTGSFSPASRPHAKRGVGVPEGASVRTTPGSLPTPILSASKAA